MKTESTINHRNSSHEPLIPQENKTAIELKGSVFTLTVLRLHSGDIPSIEAELKKRLAAGPRFFEDAPIVVDIEDLKNQDIDLNFKELSQLMRNLRLIPVGVRHGNPKQQQAAIAAGLALMKGGAIKDLPGMKTEQAVVNKPMTQKQTTPVNKPKLPDIAATDSPIPETTKVVRQPIRSGQQIYAQGGDLIVLAAVNAGAEVVADGNIHIYAPLRGRALAGVKGDKNARIFCQNMEAELVSVDGHYRVFEDQMPSELKQQTVQVFLTDGQLQIELLN